MGDKRKGRRRKGILYEYNGDCRFGRERIKGFWKMYWKRWSRRSLKCPNTIESNLSGICTSSFTKLGV